MKAKPILGQEAVCPDGLGRVVEISEAFPHEFIRVDTYVNNRSCEWAPHNVQLVALKTEQSGDHVCPWCGSDHVSDRMEDVPLAGIMLMNSSCCNKLVAITATRVVTFSKVIS